MNLGIAGKKAIVCAASAGLGKGCAVALAREGVDLVINGRRADMLKMVAADIAAETGVEVIPIAADITSEAGRKLVLDACKEPDILVNNAGGPPAGHFRLWKREDWLSALDANMLTPILLIKDVIDGMILRNFGRIVNITSSVVKSPATYPELSLSVGARSGLIGSVGTLYRQVARHNITINSLLPGQFDTARFRSLLAIEARTSSESEDDLAARKLGKIPAGRFGRIEEFGAVCAFLCSSHAEFITGQSLVLDGGALSETLQRDVLL